MRCGSIDSARDTNELDLLYTNVEEYDRASDADQAG